MTPVAASEEVVLPVSVPRAWDYLSDTARMVALDPLMESYEPATGAIKQGSTNTIVSRIGPVRLRAITRTAVLDPPHRVVFESVKPAWPLRIRTEDTLLEHSEGTLYRVTTTVDGPPLLGWILARLVVGRMMRTRRELMGRVRADIVDIS